LSIAASSSALASASPYGKPGFSSAISNSRLHFATRSPRAGAPVLICPKPVPTTRSAMNESVVSPERWETIDAIPSRRAVSIASRVDDAAHVGDVQVVAHELGSVAKSRTDS